MLISEDSWGDEPFSDSDDEAGVVGRDEIAEFPVQRQQTSKNNAEKVQENFDYDEKVPIDVVRSANAAAPFRGSTNESVMDNESANRDTKDRTPTAEQGVFGLNDDGSVTPPLTEVEHDDSQRNLAGTPTDRKAPARGKSQEMKFLIGDHVYSLVSGAPLHGIVVDWYEPWSMKVAYFSATSDSPKPTGRVFGLITDPSVTDWNKVKYNANTVDAADKVMQRVKFSTEVGPEVLPKYAPILANSECFAVWCKTGRWWSRRGNSALLPAIGLVAGSVIPVAVPAAGFAGWLGFTTTIPMAAVCPLLPVGAAVAVYFAATARHKLGDADTEWRKITECLNEAMIQSQ